MQNELDFLEKETGRRYALALRLEFAEGTQESYYTITNNAPDVEGGDKITIGSLDNWVQIEDENGDPAFRVQAIDFEADESEYYFHHLPKYNREGVVAHYTIREVWNRHRQSGGSAGDDPHRLERGAHGRGPGGPGPAAAAAGGIHQPGGRNRL